MSKNVFVEEGWRPLREKQMAVIGHPKHLEKLVDSDLANSRREVAKHGKQKHLNKLENDEDRAVVNQVAISSKDEAQLRRLLKHPRSNIAYNADMSLRRLLNHPKSFL